MDNVKEKISLAVDKRWWRPSPLLGQVVLVTSINEDGQSNVAPKSWISMMGFEPSMLALGCNLSHWTAKNILERHEFVVNVPGDDLVEVVWRTHRMPHPRPVESIGLTSMAAQQVKAPLIAECRAHLECNYVRHVAFDEEVVLFGRIVAASVDRGAIDAEDAYSYLRSFAFLEDGSYGVIEKSQRVSSKAS